MRVVKKMNDGEVVKIQNQFFFNDVDGRSSPFETLKQASDSYYIKQAFDHLGCAIRDNTREDKIKFGKQIDKGTWED